MTDDAAPPANTANSARPAKIEQAIFAAGCFWCVESVFEHVEGVTSVESGYIGGSVANPTYEQVCTGTTGHAEACRISYDPSVVSFEKLLEIFFRTHDPTTLNAQGPDVGTQYRSAVFYNDETQRETVQRIIKAIDESGAYPAKIVTTVEPATKFYSAEDYHQDYFRKNPNNSYCRAHIPPKLDKLKKAFGDQVKK